MVLFSLLEYGVQVEGEAPKDPRWRKQHRETTPAQAVKDIIR